MIKFENVVTPSGEQWESLILGARNAMNSWDRSDSEYCHGSSETCDMCYKKPNDPYAPCYCATSSIGKTYVIGPNDYDLMMRLAKGGPVHAKYRRMIAVYVDITAPLYWWKEFDTYKVGTVTNSCSTMHTIHKKEFTLEDFSSEHLIYLSKNGGNSWGKEAYINDAIVDKKYANVLANPKKRLLDTIHDLNVCREMYLKTKDKVWWWQMIQLLPSSYNQKRTVTMNYEVLANIYKSRRNHKLDCWNDFCKWIEELPYKELITGE